MKSKATCSLNISFIFCTIPLYVHTWKKTEDSEKKTYYTLLHKNIWNDHGNTTSNFIDLIEEFRGKEIKQIPSILSKSIFDFLNINLRLTLICVGYMNYYILPWWVRKAILACCGEQLDTANHPFKQRNILTWCTCHLIRFHQFFHENPSLLSTNIQPFIYVLLS